MLYQQTYADDREALRDLILKCAGRVHSNLVREQLRLEIEGKIPVGPTYHDSQIEMSARPGTGQIYVTGPSGKDFGMIQAGAISFGFSRPQFKIHHLGELAGELRAIKFDGVGKFAIGLFESPLDVKQPDGDKAAILVPLYVTDNQTGEMAPMSANVFAIPLQDQKISNLKIWAQAGSHRYFVTNETDRVAVLEISERGEILNQGEYSATEQLQIEATNIKIHQISFLGDGSTAVVHYEIGENGTHAMAMARLSENDGEKDFTIEFDTAVEFKNGRSPKSIAIQPITNLVFVNYNSSYEVFDPKSSGSTFSSVGEFAHPVAGVSSIQFHWAFNGGPRSIIITPTFTVPLSDKNKSQVYWGVPKMIQLPPKESQKPAEPVSHEKKEDASFEVRDSDNFVGPI